MIGFEMLKKHFVKEQKISLILLNTMFQIPIPSLNREISIGIVVKGGSGDESKYRWVNVSCPQTNCDFISGGMSMTNVTNAFNDAIEGRDGLHKHLRHRHPEILIYYVENEYMPPIQSLKEFIQI
ncbi:MAG: hypothetical protein Q7R95_00595 [bacterium]|nr:hypothetical protein [bacterium]